MTTLGVLWGASGSKAGRPLGLLYAPTVTEKRVTCRIVSIEQKRRVYRLDVMREENGVRTVTRSLRVRGHLKRGVWIGDQPDEIQFEVIT